MFKRLGNNMMIGLKNDQANQASFYKNSYFYTKKMTTLANFSLVTVVIFCIWNFKNPNNRPELDRLYVLTSLYNVLFKFRTLFCETTGYVQEIK